MAIVFIIVYKITDKRQKFKKVILKNREVLCWVSSFSLENFLINSKSFNNLFYTTTTLYSNHYNIITTPNQYLLQSLLLKTNLWNIFFFVDNNTFKTNTLSVLLNTFSCYRTHQRISIYCYLNTLQQQKYPSLSNIYKSSTWSERELSELYGLSFETLTDTRRLLTDYTFQFLENNIDYKTTSYNLITQDLYY